MITIPVGLPPHGRSQNGRWFDFRSEDEAAEYNLGHQSRPVNWQITSDRQRDFFELMAEIAGDLYKG